ncbi:MAG: hypothetical protein ACRDRW_04745 [Pseudonocardiaceae bacterium]
MTTTTDVPKAQPTDDDNDGPHGFHLLVADRGIQELYGTYMALCGALLHTRDLPRSECPDDCERFVSYCLRCLEVANERNADAGVGVGAWTGRPGSSWFASGEPGGSVGGLVAGWGRAPAEG